MLKNTLPYGIAGAVAFIIMHLLFWKVDLSLYLGFTQYLFYIIVFVLLVLAQVKARSVANGFIEFGDAFMVFIINAGIALVSNSVIAYIIFNIIDPEAQEKLKELVIEQDIAMTEKMGDLFGVDIGEAMDREMLETVMADQPGQFEPVNLIINFIVLIALFAIGGLISSAIIKRNPPIEFE